MTAFLIMEKTFPFNGLLKKSATLFSVGQYITLIFPLLTWSLIKKYLISMCLEYSVHEFRPFLSIQIALWLSWNKTFSFILYPWLFMKFTIHMWYGKYSVTATSSASVELFVLSFCLDDFEWMIPTLNDIVPPVWLCLFMCVANAASTQVTN